MLWFHNIKPVGQGAPQPFPPHLSAIILVIARDAFNWVAIARGIAEAGPMTAEPPL